MNIEGQNVYKYTLIATLCNLDSLWNYTNNGLLWDIMDGKTSQSDIRLQIMNKNRVCSFYNILNKEHYGSLLHYIIISKKIVNLFFV